MPRPVSSVFALSGRSDVWTADDPANGLARLLDGGLLRAGPAPAPDEQRPGLDFSTQDYLGLATHPAVRTAALGQTAMDPTLPAGAIRALEARLATVLRLPHAVTYVSGSDAIRHSLAATLCPDDDVLVDSGAPFTMFETVLATGARLHRFPSGSLDAVERRMTRLCRQPRRGRLMITVPAVSAHGSNVADLAELAALARLHGALLVVDVSHDLGAIGQDGGGVMEVQGCLGRADIVLGSLAKCFGAGGGFAAVRDPILAQTLRHSAKSVSPQHASILLAAAGIAFSPEGRDRRRNLHGIALRLRNHLMADGTRPMGSASPLVPVLLPPATALPRTALLHSAGPLVTLLQAPKVPLHAPRWRIQLSAGHGPADIDDLAELIRDVSRAFNRAPARMRVAV
jgi:7-keto-8-aminopelargonate synthetase-like enzyme